jgi:hypothetical protein
VRNECLGLHNKPQAEVLLGHKLMGPKKKKKKKKKKTFILMVSNVQLAQETCGMLHQMHISQGTSRVLIKMYTLNMKL